MEVVSSKPGIFERSILKWLIDFGRVFNENEIASDQFERLEQLYNDAKGRINKNIAGNLCYAYLDIWKNEVSDFVGAPRIHVLFRKEDSGEIVEWSNIENRIEGDQVPRVLRMVDRVDLVSSYFGRLEFCRLISFLNNLGMTNYFDFQQLAVVDNTLLSRSYFGDWIVSQSVKECLNQSKFWWFYRIPNRSIVS
jgi:hypothetical protein